MEALGKCLKLQSQHKISVSYTMTANIELT